MKTLYDRLTNIQLEAILSNGQDFPYTTDKTLKILNSNNEILDLSLSDAINVSTSLLNKGNFEVSELIKLFNN